MLMEEWQKHRKTCKATEKQLNALDLEYKNREK